MSAPLVDIVSVGMACPVGLRSRMALAAIESGITRFFDLNEEGQGPPRRASLLASIQPDQGRTDRAAVLARHAMAEAVAELTALPGGVLPCYLALPERISASEIDLPRLLQALNEVSPSGVRLRLHVDRVIESGRAGAFQALADALSVLAAGRERLVLIAGIDSLVDPQTLEYLAQSNRLLGPNNLDGIIPGEAAACLVLSSRAYLSEHRALAHVVKNAVARGILRTRVFPCLPAQRIAHAGAAPHKGSFGGPW